MSTYNGFKMAVLAASIALGLGSTAAMAVTAPAATQLPGQGKVLKGAAPTVTIDTTTSTMTVTLAASNIIDWGAGTTTADINSTGVAGFNIGADATVNFTGGGAALNIDSTGNPSQIFGKLTNAGNVFVANENGIIVGAGASITSTSGAVGLLANTLDTTSFDGSLASVRHYNGTSTGSGDVTVLAGATVHGGTPTSTVLVTGAGNVNVDLGAVTGKIGLSAGLPAGGGAFAGTNTAANVNVTGAAGGSTVDSLNSAGTATTNGKLTLTASSVDGTLTNTGDLTIGTGFVIKGGLVNNKTVTQTAAISAGSVTNNGSYAGGAFDLTTTAGGITNSGSMTGLGNVEINAGDLVNNGTFNAGTKDVNVNGGGNVTNNGDFTSNYVSINEGGNFTNAGTMTLAGSVNVVNGSITNSGKLTATYLDTASDTSLDSFTSGGQYYINNSGTVTAAAGSLTLGANSDWWSDYDGASTNDSTGSVSNTGTLQVGTGGTLDLYAHNGVNLAGTVQAMSGTAYKALSATNALGGLNIYAGGYDGAVLNTAGAATVATDIVTSGGASIYGGQVKLMSNLSSVDATGKAVDTVDIIAGAKSDTDYAVRVASGKTVTAAAITVDGDQTGDEPNTIVQGTLAAQDISFGGSNAVSDVFTGPAGSLSLSKVTANPTLAFNFTGGVKTAKYNNSSNFRFNGLNVMTDGSPLALSLNPEAYTTNGTSNGMSAVNILVNGDVALTSTPTASVTANGTAVTGVTNIPNTHLVLQSSGNISTTGNFYWPGYVYLGNVAADANGNAQPGTLGLGTIALGGDFNNVLPGDIAGASGIHFITQFPMTIPGTVVTNANAWVNFGTALLTSKYSGEQNATTGPFFGGVQGSGSVVNYSVLDASDFVTQAPDANK